MTGDGFAPVVFCRYIATAQRVAEALSNAFKSHVVDVVTGMLPPEEREIRVEELGGFDRRILVTTDCLSEGINLQAWFDAVIHYDLSWNPTRHQQREGRIDRFGQRSSRVRSVMIYGENNPVDGAVLGVILRKAHAIERQTGVRVPLPDEKGGLMKALMSAVLLRARERRQLTLDLDLDSTEEARELDLAWRNAAENEKRSRTVFAQNSLKPDEVLREWDVTQSTLGGEADTKRFVSRAMQRLDATLMPLEVRGLPRAGPPHTRNIPGEIRCRKPDRGCCEQTDHHRVWRAATRRCHRYSPSPPSSCGIGRDLHRTGDGLHDRRHRPHRSAENGGLGEFCCR